MAENENNNQIIKKNTATAHFNRRTYIFLAVLIIVSAGVVYFLINPPGWLNGPIIDTNENADALNGQSAIELTMERAKLWQSDALLSYINSGSITSMGLSNIWSLIFVSEKARGRGYEIKILNKQIISATEISYIGKASEIPVGMMTQEAAIDAVRQMKGMRDVDVVGVDAIYSDSTKTWYWGVKTSKGVVSIKATP